RKRGGEQRQRGPGRFRPGPLSVLLGAQPVNPGSFNPGKIDRISQRSKGVMRGSGGGRVAMGGGERRSFRGGESRPAGVLDPAAAPGDPHPPPPRCAGVPAGSPPPARARTARANQLLARLSAASPQLQRRLWRAWYDLLAGRYPQADWTFMNYGY